MHTLAIPIYHYFARSFDNPRENLLFLLFCQFIVSKDLYHTRCNASHEKSTRRKQRVKLTIEERSRNALIFEGCPFEDESRGDTVIRTTEGSGRVEKPARFGQIFVALRIDRN